MARKKKDEIEDLELELELDLEPTEIDDEELEEIEEADEEVAEAEMALDEEDSAPKKSKPRKKRAPRKPKAVKVEAVIEAPVEFPSDAPNEEAPKRRPRRTAEKGEAAVAEVSAPVSEAPMAEAKPEGSDKALEQIAALVKQWEASNTALATQLEKLNQKVPSPTIKAAMSWAPLARVAVGASAVSVLLAILSLVFSQSVRQQVLQANVSAPAAIARKTDQTPDMRTHFSQEDVALGGIADRARAEQAELALATSKKHVRPAHPAPQALKRKRK